MKFKNLLHILCGTALTVVAGGVVQSCSDEIEVDIPDYTVAGQTVTVSVPVKLPQMEKQSRANLSERDLNTVESLWIRTYSETTGQATSDWVKLTPGTEDTEVGRKVQLVSQSGYNYIIGVANVYTNKGVTKDNPTATPQPLSDLLDQANTWQDFLNIAVVSPSTYNDVYDMRNLKPVAMAGCYVDNLPAGGTHPSNIADWQNNNFTPYFIPTQKGVISLSGAIHLRRLASQITFNIIPARGLKVTVNSYTVCNAPKFSWLYERSAEKAVTDNFGDAAQESTVNSYYTDIPQYGSQFIHAESDGTSTFNFWQAENKHIGTATSYTEREARASLNSPLFTSLTGNSWTPNNMASYVRINCSVDYDGQINVNDDGVVNGTGSSPHYRTGDAEYFIHLGYIGGVASDFNCYRNVKYTYDVDVNGIDDIRVNAYAETPVYPGEEGIVSDLQFATVELDAHYHTFNIQLTQAELNTSEFGYIITAFDNGQQITIDEKTDLSQIDEKYYNWIELRPTTSQSVLAEYKPRYGQNNDGKTFLLSDLRRNNANSTVYESMNANWRSAQGWYTVFVNEYTYEPMYTGTDGYADERWDGSGSQPNWMSYVNQNPRRFYVRVTQKVSPDGQSIYTRSKYGISQRSLQSYYSDQTFTPAENGLAAGTAIGSERFNETEGLNVRSSFSNSNTSDKNGRYNMAIWLTNGAPANINGDTKPSWSNFVDVTQPMQIPEVVASRLQGGSALPARMLSNTLAESNPVRIPKLKNYSSSAPSCSFSDPQNTTNADYFIEAVNSCMSRNRDNNGDGMINPDELRWYVPAMGKYLRLLLGANSLSEPLMNFEVISQLPHPNSNKNGWVTTSGAITNDYLSRYMYSTSDTRYEDNVYTPGVLWAMEGMSTSSWSQVYKWSGNVSYPWQVRCIRNLGSDMTSVTDGEKVNMAYDFDNTAADGNVGGKVTFKYYDPVSLRSSAVVGNGTEDGYMPVHLITSEFNKPYYSFEYCSEDMTVTTWTLTGLKGYVEGNPCRTYNTTAKSGWRVPNQKELAILRSHGVLDTTDENHTAWLSCTVNYFNSNTGAGGTYVNGQNLFLVMLKKHGSQLNSTNLGEWTTHYIRCVRDVQ